MIVGAFLFYSLFYWFTFLLGIVPTSSGYFTRDKRANEQLGSSPCQRQHADASPVAPPTAVPLARNWRRLEVCTGGLAERFAGVACSGPFVLKKETKSPRASCASAATGPWKWPPVMQDARRTWAESQVEVIGQSPRNQVAVQSLQSHSLHHYGTKLSSTRGLFALGMRHDASHSCERPAHARTMYRKHLFAELEVQYKAARQWNPDAPCSSNLEGIRSRSI